MTRIKGHTVAWYYGYSMAHMGGTGQTWASWCRAAYWGHCVFLYTTHRVSHRNEVSGASTHVARGENDTGASSTQRTSIWGRGGTDNARGVHHGHGCVTPWGAENNGHIGRQRR